MKNIIIIQNILILCILFIFSGCTKKENGDDPEDFFSMKSTITTPVPSFNLNDFSLKPDEGFLLAGYTSANYAGYRGAVINLKPNGETVWTSDFTIDTFLYAIASFAIQQKDGFTMVAGICFNDWRAERRFVTTLGQDGKMMDHTLFPVPDQYSAAYNRIIPRSDGYFYLVSSYSPSEWNTPYILEVDLLDDSGNLVWDKLFENVNVNADQITLSSSDGLNIPGTVEHGIFDGTPDFLLIQTDKDGNEVLHKVFGSYSNWEYGNYCIEEAGKGFLFSGTTNPYGISTIYQITGEGEVKEPVFIEKYTNYTDRNYILKTKAPGYLMMSYAGSYFLFIRLNGDLSIKWSTSQVIRSPSQGYGSWSSCHFVPAGNGKFAFAYLSDNKILLFRTRAY